MFQLEYITLQPSVDPVVVPDDDTPAVTPVGPEVIPVVPDVIPVINPDIPVINPDVPVVNPPDVPAVVPDA